MVIFRRVFFFSPCEELRLRIKIKGKPLNSRLSISCRITTPKENNFFKLKKDDITSFLWSFRLISRRKINHNGNLKKNPSLEFEMLIFLLLFGTIEFWQTWVNVPAR